MRNFCLQIQDSLNASSSKQENSDYQEAPISSSIPPEIPMVTQPTVWVNPPKIGDPSTVSASATQMSSDAIIPVKKGEFFSIHMGERLYQQSAKEYIDSLIGRIVYSKGDKPNSNLELQ